jgi:hypothetical protein
MSLRQLQELMAPLPYALREQVIGYARSVRDAAGEILRDADLEFDARIADRLAFVAGLRRLYSVCSSSYWILENSGFLLRAADTDAVRIGREDFSRGSALHRRLRSMLSDLDAVLGETDARQEVLEIPYIELARKYHDER